MKMPGFSRKINGFNKIPAKIPKKDDSRQHKKIP
jgi:hypothetical protein